MRTKRTTGIFFVLALLLIGVTVVTTFVLGTAKKLNIPLGNDKLSERLLRGEIEPEMSSQITEDNNGIVKSRSLRIIYTLNEEKITGLYLEILNSPKKAVHFLEIPKSSKVSVSDELYKELLSYSPTLPQFVKVSKLDSHFSKTYRFEGMAKVLSEALGENADCWVAMDEELFEMWMKKGYDKSGNNPDDFFKVFDAITSKAESSLDASEARMYYEIYRDCTFENDGVVNGEWDKTDYIIGTIAAKELIEELKY